MSRTDTFKADNRVVSLATIRDRRSYECLDRIENYWSELRSGRLVPTRSELDPRRLEGVLGRAFILERIAERHGRFRIAGAHMTEALGVDVRGLPLTALFEPAARDALGPVMQEVFDGPSIARFRVSAPGGFGKGALTGRMILLPLRSDLGDITRVLGGISIDGEPGRMPRRLNLDDVTCDGLTGRGEAVSDRPGGRSLMPKCVTEAKEGVAPHLRLVVDNA